jgi:hypothetical protein
MKRLSKIKLGKVLLICITISFIAISAFAETPTNKSVSSIPAHECQSAFKFDPLSALKIDPPEVIFLVKQFHFAFLTNCFSFSSFHYRFL